MIPRSRTLLLTLVASLLLAGTLLAPAADAQPRRPQKATLELKADRSSYAPGDPVNLAAVMVIEDHWHTNSHQPTYDWLIPTALDLTLPEGWSEAEVSYPEGAMKTFGFTEEPISIYEGRVVMLARTTAPEGISGTGPVTASLRYQACDDSSCLPPVTTEARLELSLGTPGEPTHPEIFAAGVANGALTGQGEPAEDAAGTPLSAARTSLVWVLFLGFFGGVLLNAMPCVLPVLSLKVFGMIESANQGRRHVVVGSLATAAGILASFWALAGAALAARAAGAAVGWGTQFQHPGFVTFLTVVVVLFCLNLWGLFEIPLPQSLARVASQGPNEGLAGHFASGLFATLMATPCSAPFLGTALGFALSQKALVIFTTFTAIALGMALPFLVLAVAPGTARLLPKPGIWMTHVRTAMGFLLAGAAVWLLYVLSGQVSPEGLAFIELALLVLALFVWLGSQVASRTWAKRLAGTAVALAAVGTIALAVQADRLEPTVATAGQGLIQWVDFDRQEAEERAAEGQLVFVDVTADWCLTCKVNERVTLETDAVATAFGRHDVLPMKADWTNRNDAIGDYLAEFGKAGIPFYVLYRPGREPHVFSELLTKSSVVGAVEEAAGSRVVDLEP